MNYKKDYPTLPFDLFLSDLSSKTPTPGGGSTAALIGTVATSLACMTIEYTLGKKKTVKHKAFFQMLLREYKTIEKEFKKLIKEDMVAYHSLSKLKKRNKKEYIKGLEQAMAVPARIADLAYTLNSSLNNTRNKINPNLISDLDISIVLAKSCIDSAEIMIQVNKKEIEKMR